MPKRLNHRSVCGARQYVSNNNGNHDNNNGNNNIDNNNNDINKIIITVVKLP